MNLPTNSMPTLAFLGNLSPFEWILILGVLLLLFGRRLPEVGKSLGKGIVEFKKGIKGVEDEVNPYAPAQTYPQGQQNYNQPLPPGQPQYQPALPQGAPQPYAQQPYQAQPYQQPQAQPYPPQGYPQQQPYPPQAQPYPPQGYQPQPGPAR